MILDLFAGPGGWDEGVRDLGLKPVGVEWDTDACATAEAAGHARVRLDVAAGEPLAFHDVDGLIASPPCQGFSAAGKGRGRDDALLILEALRHVRHRRDLERELRGLHEHMTDDRSLLALEPLRYALATLPGWLAWEQVPAVLPLWEWCAGVLRRLGYTAATGILNAEQYGVPQTRRRAILVARSAWLTAELGPARLPAPTHSRYYSRDPQRLDPGVLPWVSMAQALEWSPSDRVGFPRLHERDSNKSRESIEVNGTAYRARDLHLASRPAPALTEKARSWIRVQYVNGNQAHSARRDLDRPAPTVHFAERQRVVEWQALNAAAEPVASVRVNVDEASVLQSFPGAYPWGGSRTAQYRQVGDAVPPLLARAIVAEVAGIGLSDDSQLEALGGGVA